MAVSISNVSVVCGAWPCKPIKLLGIFEFQKTGFMVLIAQVLGTIYGLLAIVLGAFGAHALKKSFSEEQLKSFETGVKYQMYHAILLLVLGFNLNLDTSLERSMIYCIGIGTLLFSFSIYALTLGASKGRNMRILGPVTPLGGLLLVIGWALLLFIFVKEFV